MTETVSTNEKMQEFESVNNTEVQNTEQETQEVLLSLTDIADAAKILKAVLERGQIFEADEIVGISEVYKNLNNFVKRQAELHHQNQNKE